MLRRGGCLQEVVTTGGSTVAQGENLFNYMHVNYRNVAGMTRISELWDQLNLFGDFGTTRAVTEDTYFNKSCVLKSNPGFFWLLFAKDQGRVVRKPVNANPGIKVNRRNNFSCIKELSIAYVFHTLRLPMLKTEGQKL